MVLQDDAASFDQIAQARATEALFARPRASALTASPPAPRPHVTVDVAARAGPERGRCQARWRRQDTLGSHRLTAS